jgi:DNA-directed RNA polymerase subunit M/transcription elongation factor TFIIS
LPVASLARQCSALTFVAKFTQSVLLQDTTHSSAPCCSVRNSGAPRSKQTSSVLSLTFPVCPTCSNMLRVSKVPPGDPTTEDYVGQNRFECLTCPYHFVINKRYFERKYMKKKEVEDILGGKGAWDNVDKTQGTLAEEIAEDGIKCSLWVLASHGG